MGSIWIILTVFFFYLHYVCGPSSCLAHVLEVAQGPVLTARKDHKFDLLESFLMESTSHIERVMDTANAIKLKINSLREEVALRDCVKLMNMSIDRIWDSMEALTKQTTKAQENAHTWLSTVLANHVTCFDGLEGEAWAVMEVELEDLLYRAKTCLAMLVAVLPPKFEQIIDEPLNGEFPSWVTSKDRKLLGFTARNILADVVVAQDGSGNFSSVAEAVASAPNNSNTRYVIYVKEGTYKENVEINSNKKNVMLVGDGMNATIITSDLNYMEGVNISKSATVAVDGDGFIAQDICFQNTAGPQKMQAVALRVAADQSVINRCGIDAYQDTLYVQSNRQFYRDSFVTGTIDFIFGDAAVVFQKCQLVARLPMKGQYNVITAQGRENSSQNSGISIQQCDIIPAMDLKPSLSSVKTFLGRPWMKFSRTVVMQSFIDGHIDPTGWTEFDARHKDYLQTLYYGEYMNSGPGADTSQRVNWTGYHIITTEEEASNFTVKNFIQGDLWLPSTGVNFTTGLKTFQQPCSGVCLLEKFMYVE